jgi:hypothetical protein
MSGKTVSEDNLGLGPARYITSSEVQEISEAISTISKEELLKNYDPEKIVEADIYPTNAWTLGQENLDYISTYYEELVKFFKKASEENEAVIMWVS